MNDDDSDVPALKLVIDNIEKEKPTRFVHIVKGVPIQQFAIDPSSKPSVYVQIAACQLNLCNLLAAMHEPEKSVIAMKVIKAIADESLSDVLPPKPAA